MLRHSNLITYSGEPTKQHIKKTTFLPVLVFLKHCYAFALNTYNKIEAGKAKIIPNFVCLLPCLLCRKRGMLTCCS